MPRERKTKKYCVTLEEKEVKTALDSIKQIGGKFSTLMNSLLKSFNGN